MRSCRGKVYRVVSHEMAASMKNGSVDVAVGQGGCFKRAVAHHLFGSTYVE